MILNQSWGALVFIFAGFFILQISSLLSIALQVSKTPGGRVVFLYRKKNGSVPRCGDTGVKLKGVSLLPVYIEWL